MTRSVIMRVDPKFKQLVGLIKVRNPNLSDPIITSFIADKYKRGFILIPHDKLL